MFRLFLFISVLGSSLQASPLETAHHLAETHFDGWTYGSRAQEKKVDCVQFMSAVVSAELGRRLTKEERDAININHGWTAEEIQAKAAAGADPLISGIHYALADFMQVAEKVKPAEAQPGDFIQYWKRAASGKWFGHASLISRVTNGTAKLYGSHKSTNGIAESDFQLKLTGDDRHVFVVRLDPAKLEGAQLRQDGMMFLPVSLATRAGNQLTWDVAFKRWGMYDLACLRPGTDLDAGSDIQALATSVTLLEKSAEWKLPAPKALRIYVEKPGTYQVALTFKDAVPLAMPMGPITLTPAPEGTEVLSEADGQVVLHSRDSTVRGKTLRYEPNPKKRCLGFWSDVNDRAEWQFNVAKPGKFRLEIDQGCGKGHGGSRAYVSVAGREYPFTVEDTGHFQNFKTRVLGEVELPQATTYLLTVGGKKKAKGAVMDVREIRLVRQ